MEYDIRENVEKIDKIVFDSTFGVKVYLEQDDLHPEKVLKIRSTHSDEDDYYCIRYSAIDDLIKALQKAKELWDK